VLSTVPVQVTGWPPPASTKISWPDVLILATSPSCVILTVRTRPPSVHVTSARAGWAIAQAVATVTATSESFSVCRFNMPRSVSAARWRNPA
jgi:hypothetical protein